MTAAPSTPAVCPSPEAESVPATSRASSPPTVMPTVTPEPGEGDAAAEDADGAALDGNQVRVGHRDARSQPQGAADDLLHDLGRAAVDRLDPGVAPGLAIGYSSM